MTRQDHPATDRPAERILTPRRVLDLFCGAGGAAIGYTQFIAEQLCPQTQNGPSTGAEGPSHSPTKAQPDPTPKGAHGG
jgi:hypothetical protein